MVGKAGLLVLLAFVAGHSFGQSATPAPTSSPAPEAAGKRPLLAPGLRRPGSEGMSAEFADVRKAIAALTPEQRQRFADNFKRWASLPPEERNVLVDREALRRKKMAEDIDTALNQAGLQLSGERRAQFARRYGDERRKIEEQLRTEMDEKRQPLLKDIISKLKGEFSGSPTADGQ